MADSTFAVLNLGSQRVSGAIFGKTRTGELVLKSVNIAEMHGDPGAEATRLPQLRMAAVELAESLRLSGRPVWYAIAGHVVFTRFVKLPPFEDDKADQIVEFEARQNVPFPINEVIWDYEFIGDKSGPEREVALVAIKADALDDINEQLEDRGIKVAGVDLAPLALSNAFRYGYPDVDVPTLLIDLGAKSTNLVFIEGDRLFTRNILVGGCAVTGNIAKELNIKFGEAEDRKRAQGFVSPGGTHEPHEDEEVDAISKIIRNTMTRLHGEIIRTIHYYRTQQSGSIPQCIFLCGGGAQTPLITEFFSDKFNLPVEVMNPLRGVQVESRAQAIADANTPSMGELVGLALRHIGSAPVEVDLVPESVARSRETTRRVPLLLLSMACLFAALGSGIFYFKKASELVHSKLDGLSGHYRDLEKYDKELKKLQAELTSLKTQSAQLEDAVKSRGWWNHLLTLLNNKFENDYIWITQLEVLKNGNALTNPLSGGGTVTGANAANPAAKGGGSATAPNYELRIQGLYRKNDKEQKVVYEFYDALTTAKDAEEFFSKPPAEQKPEVETGATGEDRYAYKFKFRLPLAKDTMKFEK
ncbi:MAG: pilus assembly protein PilM [Verrucomicrobia bacterium]|nr:pilus assembly protein PilM [Verrucomicrobiota bacterium]